MYKNFLDIMLLYYRSSISKTSSRGSSQEMDNDYGSTELGSSFTPASNNCSYAQLRPTSEFSRQPTYNSPAITYKQQQVCNPIVKTGIYTPGSFIFADQY